MPTVEIKCTIDKLFKNCPKPDGWFGCFAHSRKEGNIKLTGKTTTPLAEGMTLEIIAENNGADNEYLIKEMKIVTKTITGTISYLCSLNGVSRPVARKLVITQGVEIIDIIKKGKEELTKFCNEKGLDLTEKQITALVTGVTNSDIKNEMLQFLPEIAAGTTLATRVYEWLIGVVPFCNNETPFDMIERDPYILCEVPGMPFLTVDTIAIRLGVDPLSVKRIGHALEYVLSTNSSGDMYIDLSDSNAIMKLCGKLEHQFDVKFETIHDFEKLLLEIVNSNQYNVYLDHYTDGHFHLYNKELYANMLSVVDRIHSEKYRTSYFVDENIPSDELKHCITDYENKISIKANSKMILNKEQRNAVKNALNSRISIITGGPGRGKTTMIDCLAYCWTRLCKGSVVLLAPTGKAMNKLKSSVHIFDGIGDYTARTVDSIICQVEHMRAKDSSNSLKKFDNQYETKKCLIIVDESSMLDIEKASRLLDISSCAQFCFVGDADQLPPISPGCFFKDLIDASSALTYIPVTYLKTPLRNSGAILMNAEKINNNDTDLAYDINEMPFFPQNSDDQTALDFIIDQYNDERIDNPDMTQIALLCPMRKGTTGTNRLNIEIQKIACPENKNAQPVWDIRRQNNVIKTKGYPIPELMFGDKENFTKIRVGDIIINSKNNNDVEAYFYTNNDYWNGNATGRSLGFYNGDCGRIIGYIPVENPNSEDIDKSHSHLIVELFGKNYESDAVGNQRIITLDITNGETDNIGLGYAMTVHKAQGCEYQTVIYVSPARMLNMPDNGFASKNLVYTAVTRAKNRVIIIGSKDALNKCIKSNLPKRNSNFKERLMS